MKRFATPLKAAFALATVFAFGACSMDSGRFGSAGIGSGPASGSFAAALSDGDREFVRMAASSGMLEVQASELAAQRSQDSTVRAFAQRMVNEHTAANKNLALLATRKGMRLSDDLDPKHQAMLDKLRGTQGAAFDREYTNTVGVAAHREAVELHEKAARDAKDPDIRTFAQRAMPSLRQHLSMAQQAVVALR